MKLTVLKSLLLLLSLSLGFLHAQERLPLSEKTPEWITQNPVNYNNDKLNEEAEDGYIDLVYEKQVNLSLQTYYYKKTIKILTESGVQNGSKISVSYDPSFQKLVFHDIKIIRNNAPTNKLELSKIKTIQEEKELDRFVYNGLLTAVLLLEDVRKGDVIEYSYSIRGMNPVFNGKYADLYDAAFSVPVSQLFYKLVIPQARNIRIKNSRTNVKPTISHSGKDVVYEWKFDGVDVIHVQNNIPSWYDVYPTILVSEYKTWKEVNDWALHLFPSTLDISLPLQQKIEEIKKANATTEARLLAALRFVQDEVRYMGIEMGAGTHKPHHPNQVFAQRFGDCKDKSYLLCALLKTIGVEAHPVLINTTYKRTISDWLPSPTSFDHATVQIKLNGKNYYVDPTISYQRGSRLDDISFPDYQVGLALTDTTKNLVEIPFKKTGTVKIKQVFNMKDLLGRAQFIVTTDYSGSFADDTRQQFKSSSLIEIKTQYKKFYNSYFDKINADSISHNDNPVNGVFQTIEYYTIDDFWGTRNSFKEAYFKPYIINNIIRKPSETNNSMPYQLSFPANYVEDIVINLPDYWSIKESVEKINSGSFRMFAKYTCTGKKVILHYEYENLKDHVLPGEMKEYIANVDKANKNLGYSLSQTTQEETGTSLTMFSSNYSLLYVVLGLCVVITVAMRRRNG